MQIRSFRFVLCLLLVVLTCSTNYGQDERERIMAAAEEALAAYDVPGFSLGVIKDGEVIIAKGFGVLEAGESELVDEHSIFAIASNTKAFIGTSLAVLDHETDFSLDDYVQQHLPYFRSYDAYVSQHATVRDLLCHRMGLGTFSGDVIWYRSELPAEQVVRQARHVPQAYEWRAGYGYTNLMFITAGEVIQAVSGQPWHSFLQERFFDPLGMERTFTSTNDIANLNNVATPHITRQDNKPIPYVNWDNMGAAGGILSSAADMLSWIQLQLNGGQHKGQWLFPKSVRNTCWAPHNARRNSETLLSYGLGWGISLRNGQRVIAHGGGYDGMYSRVMMLPDQHLGIVILTNSMTGLPSRLANFIADTYTDTPTDGWLEQAIFQHKRGLDRWDARWQERLDARVEGTSASLPNAAYLGTYFDPMYGTITVGQQEEELVLSFEHAPDLSAQLSHWHYDTWQIHWAQPQAWFDSGTIQFLIDNNRKVSGIRFDVPNDDIFFHEIEAERVED